MEASARFSYYHSDRSKSSLNIEKLVRGWLFIFALQSFLVFFCPLFAIEREVLTH